MIRILLALISISIIASCKEASKTKAKPPELTPQQIDTTFLNFVSGFEMLEFPVFMGNRDFLKKDKFQINILRIIEDEYLHKYFKMDSLPEENIYYMGQLPMQDSVFYLINYFEIKGNYPSQWWTLNKFTYYGQLISETQLAYNAYDGVEVNQRMCKVDFNYQSNTLNILGKFDTKSQTITDTTITTKVVNLLLPEPE